MDQVSLNLIYLISSYFKLNFSRQFLAFLSETETLCENAESEIDRNPLMFKVS